MAASAVKFELVSRHPDRASNTFAFVAKEAAAAAAAVGHRYLVLLPQLVAGSSHLLCVCLSERGEAPLKVAAKVVG